MLCTLVGAIHGAQSAYGSDIPLACVGIISKVGMIFFAIVIGISQGIQPIADGVAAVLCIFFIVKEFSLFLCNKLIETGLL